MIIFQRQVFLNGGIACKWQPDFRGVEPKFGRNWFLWLPHFKYDIDHCTHLTVSWLFYFFTLTIYWRKYKHDGSCQATPLLEK